MLEMSGKHEAQVMLDVGSGQGIEAILLSKRGNRVIGIDISREAVRTASILNRNENTLGQASFVVGDAEHLPFRSDSFDTVCCRDVLHHVSDSTQTVLEMKRVAREKGSIMALEANALNPQMIVIGMIYFWIDRGVFRNTGGRLQKLFLDAGLSQVNVIETEFLPRHMLFEYRSPANIVLRFKNFPIADLLRKIEKRWQRQTFLRKFSNYLLIVGSNKE
jgi:SAM-dependent methyltransferase